MVDPNVEKKISKKLSYVLRHDPGSIYMELDKDGWANSKELLKKLFKPSYLKVSMEDLEYVVANNSKKRFSFNENKTKIRANQGHSIDVDLGLEPTTPPESLFHGTAGKFVDSIFKNGLIKKGRQHVHLSTDTETASKVGQRHGKLVILQINTMQMQQDGYEFFISENKVWLTDNVPSKYITIYR